MKIINAPEASQSIVQSVLDPIKSLLRTTNNICRSAEVISEIVLEGAELTKAIAMLSLDNQLKELEAKSASMQLA